MVADHSPTDLLRVEKATTTYRTVEGDLTALDRVSLAVARGASYGLVGESGCGKSTLLKTVIGVLPPNGRLASGSIAFDGLELTTLPDEEMRRLRWSRMSMITQSAMNALDPVHPVGWQVVEAIRAHRKVDRAGARAMVEEMFDLVGIDRDRFAEFPHQFSGGMRQRAIIAMALILKPDLVIADEPTTSLDVIVQDQIFRNIKKLQDALGFSMLLVTHDMALVIENCDRIGVMYGGVMVETGTTEAVVNESGHPYTMGLKNSFPNVLARDRDLISIPGSPPRLSVDPQGCPFEPRCPFARDICREKTPPLTGVGPGHHSACHFSDRAPEMRGPAARAATWQERAAG